MNQPAQMVVPEEVTDAVRLIKEKYPSATFFGVTSSDQGRYGFLLTEVGFEDDSIIDCDSDDGFSEWSSLVDDELVNVDWGVFGDRNADSDFYVDITTLRIIRSA